MDDAMDCLMSFSDFLFAFQIQFYYSGESLPGPRGSCGTTVPDSRPALWPLRLRLWPALSAPPRFMAGFPAGCAVLAGGHKTRPAGPTHSAFLTTRKATVLPASRGTHISLSDSHGHTTPAHAAAGRSPRRFPLAKTCCGPGPALGTFVLTAALRGRWPF